MVMKILRSRKFSRRVLAVVVLLFLPPFVFWGIGGFSDRQAVIGTIHGRKILAEDLAQSLEAMRVQVILSNFNDYQTMQKILQNRELMNYISWQRLVLEDEARRQKIKISNADVIAYITKHPLFMRNGVFSQEIYNSLLKNTLSITPRDFEEDVRGNLAVQAVRDSIFEGIAVSDNEVSDFYNRNFGKIGISYLLIDRYAVPEEPAVEEKDLRMYFEAYKENFYEPEQVEIEYIELPYAGADEKSAAARKINAAYSALLSSPDAFQKISEGLGLKYAKPEAFSAETVISGKDFFPGFYETCFSLGKGEMSAPVFSGEENGSVYVIRKRGSVPRREKSFEEVSSSLEEPAKERKYLEKAKEKAEVVYASLSSGGITLERAAEAENLDLFSAVEIGPDSYIEGFGPVSDILAEFVNAAEGEILEPVVSTKGVIIARLDKRFPPDEKDFSEKKDRIKRLLLIQKQGDAFDAWFTKKTETAKLKIDIKEL